jgi:hypothetical protein
LFPLPKKIFNRLEALHPDKKNRNMEQTTDGIEFALDQVANN